jgi:hypothetical protein
LGSWAATAAVSVNASRFMDDLVGKETGDRRQETGVQDD